MIWVVLAGVGGLLAFALLFLALRWLSDVSTARMYGWAAAGDVYGTTDLSNSGWLPLKKIYWSSSLGSTASIGSRAEMFYFYFNCKYQVTDAGLGLRWGGRNRPRSEPKNHPVLLFPWSNISPAAAVAEKGRGRPGNVVIIAPSQVAGVGIAIPALDANQIVQASAGRFTVRPSRG